MRVIIASRDPSVRSALCMLLRAHDDLNVVGEVSDLSHLPRILESTSPDVAIVDLDGPGVPLENLLAAVRLLDTPPLIFGLSVRATNRTMCMNAGADGFAYKGDAPDRLLDAIRSRKIHKVK